tara:strand:+ start:263 stop:514 length:252 start_codon:yes stop_codon:yes gene_type:complete
MLVCLKIFDAMLCLSVGEIVRSSQSLAQMPLVTAYLKVTAAAPLACASTSDAKYPTAIKATVQKFDWVCSSAFSGFSHSMMLC